jgi:hypothetical protein
MEMMIRLSKEFGFKISAFHHALEAYKLRPELVAEGIAAGGRPRILIDQLVGKTS